MPDPLRRLLVLAVTLVAAWPLAPAAAQDEEPPVGDPVSLGAYATPLRFEAPDGVTFELDGRRYAGTIEVRLAPDGDLVVIDELSMNAYVEGIAEMPARWPLEALKAQAVASRTYAWFELAQGRWGRFGFDICASTSCQVFHGREVVETPEVGERWAQAVAETRDEVLMHDGEPILARYFSTSGGHTRDNEHVYPDEGPRPYLKGVEDPDDAVSPLHRWTTTFTREQMDAILARGDELSAAVPIADIEHLTAPGGGADQVVVTGRDGTEVRVGASTFRFFVSDVAPELYPDEFPGDRPDGRPLPVTLPSSRFDVEVTDDQVVIDGRGWGHGVGLGQFGAMGKAERGLGYREILAAYYNGLEPSTPDALPDRIRVGLTTDAADVSLSADGPFTVRVGDEVITDRGLGTWAVAARDDRSMALAAPPGYGAPLVIAPTEVSRPTPTSVETITAETVVNKPVELAMEVRDRATGELVRSQDLGVVEAGRHAAVWDLDDADGQQVPAGSYDVRMIATDEGGEPDGHDVTVEVVVPTIPDEDLPTLLAAATPVPERGTAGAVMVAVLVGVVVGALSGALVGRRP